MKIDTNNTHRGSRTEEFARRVRANQTKLRSELRPHYDFIVCGSGSSGSVVVGRLAANPDVNILLLEAGGNDDNLLVREPGKWPMNLGTERDWGFKGQPNPHLNGRSIPLSMGKVLGGGSSINGMGWARGHKSDWDFFASETGDPAWSYESVLNIYRRIEDWHGAPDPKYRGTGGPVFVQPAPDPNPIAPAMVEGARSIGIPTFEHHNGRMMEGDGGAAIFDLRIRDGQRLSVFRSYTYPRMAQSNLTVLTNALVTRLTFDGKRATGIEFVPGVGQNFQDHFGIGCIWEYNEPLAPRNNAGEATYFWKSDSRVETPDLQTCQVEVPYCSAENAAKFNPPSASWTLLGSVVRPKSRGRIRLTGPRTDDPIQIEANTLSHPDDLKGAIACVELCREVGNSLPLRPYTKREVMPGNLRGPSLEDFIRDAAATYHHQTCTAKMGRDSMSVVDAGLKVYGIENLRIADGSIMPRVTTGNTMAPCVIIGERASEILRTAHKLSGVRAYSTRVPALIEAETC